MKIASWFICILVIILSCAPCTDAAAYNQSPGKLASSNAFLTEHHEGRRTDACSPFCVCACCSTPTVIRQVLLFVNIPLSTNQKYSEVYSGDAIAALVSIWQPPQLG